MGISTYALEELRRTGNSRLSHLIFYSMEPSMRIELTTPSLPWRCSTTELGRLDLAEPNEQSAQPLPARRSQPRLT